jgi:hypothetical protein
MKPTLWRTMLGGVAGFAAFVLALFLTFAQFGGSRRGQTGLLFNPQTQSPKLIAVWKEIEPLPLLIERPAIMFVGYLAFAVSSAFVYRSVRSAWPPGVSRRGWRMALIVWACAFFFELQGPVNLFHEPVLPLSIALSFWAIAALALAFTIVVILDGDSTRRRPAARTPQREESMKP